MKNRSSHIFSNIWHIATREAKSGSILADKQSAFKIHKNPVRYWCADPLTFCNDGKTYIFAEMFDYIHLRGVIGVCEYKNGKLSKWKPVLKESFHLSYPFVFKLDNDIYMMPETEKSNELRIYKAVNFPYEWKIYKTFLKGRTLVDTTLYDDGEVLKGFTLEMCQDAKSYIVTIDKKLDDIRLVLEEDSNLETFRCGGKVFEYGNKRIRVCQDCIAVYGNGLIFREFNADGTFSEIDHIMPSDVKFESPVSVVGIHTYSSTDEIEVLDLRTREFNFLDFFFRACLKIGLIKKK